MVAYSFQPRFIEPIIFGQKHQTIRAVGKRRHARPGEDLQLYTGMRTRHCRLVGKATCQSVEKIRIDFQDSSIHITHEDGTPYLTIRDAARLDAFARLDGFRDFNEFRDFWAEEHGPLARWSGVIIRWREFSQ